MESLTNTLHGKVRLGCARLQGSTEVENRGPLTATESSLTKKVIGPSPVAKGGSSAPTTPIKKGRWFTKGFDEGFANAGTAGCTTEVRLDSRPVAAIVVSNNGGPQLHASTWVTPAHS